MKKLLMIIGGLCAMSAYSDDIVAPAMPPPGCDDTEVVTNVALPAVRADSRLFALRLELDATPSNNVEVAFGRNADGDGALSRFEATMRVGWDCGVWELVNCATGDVFSEPGSPGPVSLSWMLNFSPAGVPKSLATSVSGTGVFAAFAEHPPQFLFSKDWNMVRVTCRGLDAPNPRIDCSARNIPLVIRIR